MADDVSRAPQTFQTHDPSTGQPGKAYPGHSVEQAKAIVADARQAWESWRRTDFATRKALMWQAAQVLRGRIDHLAELMTAEMGKTLTEGRAEVEKCAHTCEVLAQEAESYLAPIPVAMDGGARAQVAFRPIGVVLAVMPWNFPFWQVIRFAAPALMAGNAGVLKHASNAPGCALAIEQVFREAGFPENLFRTLLLSGREMKAIIEDPNIAAVTLTGSVPAGRQVAATAGGVLKKTVLELGGSDAYLVLSDADIAFTAAACAKGRLVNSGQSCIAAKRFIVLEALKD